MRHNLNHIQFWPLRGEEAAECKGRSRGGGYPGTRVRDNGTLVQVATVEGRSDRRGQGRGWGHDGRRCEGNRHLQRRPTEATSKVDRKQPARCIQEAGEQGECVREREGEASPVAGSWPGQHSASILLLPRTHMKPFGLETSFLGDQRKGLGREYSHSWL